MMASIGALSAGLYVLIPIATAYANMARTLFRPARAEPIVSPSAISVGAAGKAGCGTFSIEPARKKRGCAVISLTVPLGLCPAAAADGWGRSCDCTWVSIEGITLPSTE